MLHVSNGRRVVVLGCENFARCVASFYTVKVLVFVHYSALEENIKGQHQLTVDKRASVMEAFMQGKCSFF